MPRAIRENDITEDAVRRTSWRTSRSRAPSSSSAPSMPMCNRIPDRRPTWPSTSPCSSPATRSWEWICRMADIAGLVVTGNHPSPVPYADFVTTTTHKTLRGPRAGLILCKEKYAKDLDRAVFPGVQGGPLVHIVAAKAVAFKEAAMPEFNEYQTQIIRNAKALAQAVGVCGFRIVSGGTDNHLFLTDVFSKGITGKDGQNMLEAANITANKNTIPFDTQKPMVASGLRIGTPAVTTR